MDSSLPPSRCPPLPDLNRLVEDLTATAALFDECAARGRRLHPSMAILTLLGSRLLGDDPLDAAAAALRAQPWTLAPIVTEPQLTVLEGGVRLSYFLAAIAYAGAPTTGAPASGGWDWEAALGWLVLRGISAHRLWSFLPSWFVADLLRPTLRRSGHRLSPLQLLLLRACPELGAALPPPDDAGFAAQFAAWLAREGCARFGLFWLCTLGQLAAGPEAAAPAPADDLVWPEDPPGMAAAPHGAATRLGEYGGFGAAFPGLRVDLAAAVPAAPWRPATAAGAPGVAVPAAGLDLTALHGPAALPVGWLPPGMMLLELQVAATLAPLIWLQAELDGQPVGRWPGDAVARGQPLSVLVPQGTRTAAPLLGLRVGCRPAAFAHAARAGGVFARLAGLHFWRLR